MGARTQSGKLQENSCVFFSTSLFFTLLFFALLLLRSILLNYRLFVVIVCPNYFNISCFWSWSLFVPNLYTIYCICAVHLTCTRISISTACDSRKCFFLTELTLPQVCAQFAVMVSFEFIFVIKFVVIVFSLCFRVHNNVLQKWRNGIKSTISQLEQFWPFLLQMTHFGSQRHAPK